MLQQSIAGDILTIQDLIAINVIVPDWIVMNQCDDQTTLDTNAVNTTTTTTTTTTFSSNKENYVTIQFGTSSPLVPTTTTTTNKSAAVGIKGKKNGRYSHQMKNIRSVTPTAIKKAVETRNDLFRRALDKFIDDCKEMAIDVDTCLHQKITASLPSVNNPPIITQIPDQSREDVPLTMEKVIGDLHLQKFCGEKDRLDKFPTKTFPAQEAHYGEALFSQEIQEAMSESGIHKLYTHQAEAISGLRNRQHVITTTSTASGKSLVYQLYILEALLDNPLSTALLIFPTKALAQDQLASFKSWLLKCPSLSNIKAVTLDGDTPTQERALIRKNASVIFTNPDVLHYAILPNSSHWRPFLTQLCFIVIDELHIYNGSFGSNVALILRRLRRVCHYFGNTSALCVSCSATLQDPEKHMQQVLGVDNVKTVDQDGAPCGKKEFILWNPPLLNPEDKDGVRRSVILECADILEYLLSRNVRTIAFCKTRKTCELLMRQMREKLSQEPDRLKKLMSYRGGYTPQERRRIEHQLFNGQLLGVIATNALELGIDIGSLDAVVMIGVPWSISSLWQQSGRAGRRHTDSLSIVITNNDPMDQYYAKHPSALFDQKPAPLHLHIGEKEDSALLERHLQCAAEEWPLDITKDTMFFGPNIKTICEEHLVPIDNGLYRPHHKFRPYPAEFVPIRNITEEIFVVVDITDKNEYKILEEIETSRAPFEIHKGAIFIHQGQTYLVDECNIIQRCATVHLVRVDWTTSPRDSTNVNTVRVTNTKSMHCTQHTVSLGSVQVETVVFGYHKVDKYNRIIDSLDVYMDPVVQNATGVWTDVPYLALQRLETLEINPMAAIHSAEHALINVLPRFGISSNGTLKIKCKSPHKDLPTRILVYELQLNGVVQKVYQIFESLLKTSADRIQQCSCEHGCPTCIQLSACSEGDLLHSKKGALIIFWALLGKL
ncbi:P-loop containing nucleoside triphosphate hydrolase protein [Phycomyces blakesleeanus]|uniref:P-loop containing nucleoside triphosphate hydrolase protein n=1 Tax=Phycomyces blakesleeanus TaxID=4837 RepID=A0ABR3B9L1_PHYBL